MIVLPIREQGMSCHFLNSCTISFLRAQEFSLHSSFNGCVRLLPKSFIDLDAIVKAVVSLVFLSVSLFVVSRKAINFSVLALYPATFLNLVITSSSLEWSLEHLLGRGSYHLQILSLLL